MEHIELNFLDMQDFVFDEILKSEDKEEENEDDL